MKRLFLFLFAAILGISQVWGAYYTCTYSCTNGSIAGYYGSTESSLNNSFTSGLTYIFSSMNTIYVKISVTPSSGYVFEKWTVTGIQSTDYTQTTSGTTTTIVFKMPNANVVVSATCQSGSTSGGGGNTTGGSGNYKHTVAVTTSTKYNGGTVYIDQDAESSSGTYTTYCATSNQTKMWIHAVPNDGWKVKGWGTASNATSDSKTSQNPYQVTGSSSGSYSYAVFEEVTCTANVNNSDYGTASASTFKAVRNLTKDTYGWYANYKTGTVTLTATPKKGYEFVNWTNGTTGLEISTEAEYVYSISSTCTVYANFKKISSDPTIYVPQMVDLGLPSGTKWADKNLGATSATEVGDFYRWGGVEAKERFSSSDSYSAATLDDEHDAAYQAFKDKDNGAWCMPTEAQFRELMDDNNCSWEWQSSSPKGYIVTSKSNGNSIFLPAGGTYDPDYDYPDRLFYWTSTGNKVFFYNGSNPKNITTYTAYFGCNIRPVYAPKYTLTVQSNNTNYGTVSGSGNYRCGTSVTITASAITGYHLDKWNDNNTSTSRTITTGSAAATYTATFAVNKFSLQWLTDGDALAGDYTHGDEIAYGTTITAPNTPTKSGYVFAGWSNGTSVVPPAATMPDNALTYTATWKQLTLVDDKGNNDAWYTTTFKGFIGTTSDVTYQRTFPAGTMAAPSWSVFSLPFEYFIDEVGATFADKVLNMDYATYDGEILSIYCTYETVKIKANKPYILYNTGAEIENPVFAGVKVQALAEESYSVNCTEGGTVTFKNTTCYQQLEANNKNILFIGDNQLYYPGGATYLRAFRGYFVLDGVRAASAPKRVRLMVNETTGLESNMQNEQQSATEKVIEGGAMYIIRNGVRYDARGAEIR